MLKGLVFMIACFGSAILGFYLNRGEFPEYDMYSHSFGVGLFSVIMVAIGMVFENERMNNEN